MQSDDRNEVGSKSENGENKQNLDLDSKIALGAGAIGAGLGLMISGPGLALVGGTALAVASLSDKGNVGKIARSTGETSVALYDKAKELNGKHHIIEKAKDGTNKMIQKSKNIDNKYQISEKVSKTSNEATKFIVSSMDKIKESVNNSKK